MDCGIAGSRHLAHRSPPFRRGDRHERSIQSAHDQAGHAGGRELLDPGARAPEHGRVARRPGSARHAGGAARIPEACGSRGWIRRGPLADGRAGRGPHRRLAHDAHASRRRARRAGGRPPSRPVDNRDERRRDHDEGVVGPLRRRAPGSRRRRPASRRPHRQGIRAGSAGVGNCPGVGAPIRHRRGAAGDPRHQGTIPRVEHAAAGIARRDAGRVSPRRALHRAAARRTVGTRDARRAACGRRCRTPERPRRPMAGARRRVGAPRVRSGPAAPRERDGGRHGGAPVASRPRHPAGRRAHGHGSSRRGPGPARRRVRAGDEHWTVVDD